MDDEKIVEQPETVDPGAGNQVVKDSTSYGNFTSADDLLKAYKNLQAEFTRKSQEIAEIKKDMASVVGEKTLDAGDEANGDEKKAKEVVRDQILAEYLGNVAKRNVPPTVIGQGAFVATQIDGKPTMNYANDKAKKFFGGRS